MTRKTITIDAELFDGAVANMRTRDPENVAYAIGLLEAARDLAVVEPITDPAELTLHLAVAGAESARDAWRKEAELMAAAARRARYYFDKDATGHVTLLQATAQ